MNYVIIEKADRTGLVKKKVPVKLETGKIVEEYRWFKPGEEVKKPKKEEKEKKEEPKSKAKVGETIPVAEGLDAKVTSVGKDGVTATDDKGDKHPIKHANIEVMPDEIKKYFPSNSEEASNAIFIARFEASKEFRTGKESREREYVDIEGTAKALDLATTKYAAKIKDNGRKGIMIEIELLAGQTGAYGFLDQKEFILPRNTKFEIVDIKKGIAKARIVK